MNKYAICAIGYNRLDSLSRLLKSLSNADYGDDNVTLIISIDNSGSDILEKYAEMFDWKYGNKIVRTFPERQGLRKHVLKCGRLVVDYDAIAIFEDDVIVSPAYYQYMKQAVEFYEKSDKIAGISLYTHRWNVATNTPFIPEVGSKDVFFLQYAQSWGQVWMKKQWLDFEKWYKDNSGNIGNDPNIPKNVREWPNSSWLKYHIKYCIEKDKYFVYPNTSLSTCFSEVGQHCKEKERHLHVSMMNDCSKQYDFCRMEDKNYAIIYDAFFERIGIDSNITLEGEVTVDIYGYKESELIKRYWLTTKRENYKIINKYSLELRPHELNIVYGINGDDIFLYDTHTTIQNNFSHIKDKDIIKFKYYHKIANNNKAILYLAINIIKKHIRKRMLNKK